MCTRNALYSHVVVKGGSEMKHIPKDYKVKMYIPRESVNQNVVIVGERNDEDNAVPSVMKLLEKLTDRGHTSSPDRRKNRGSCHKHSTGRIPERVVVRIVNMSGHTHSGGEDRQGYSISRSELPIVSKHDPAVNQ